MEETFVELKQNIGKLIPCIGIELKNQRNISCFCLNLLSIEAENIFFSYFSETVL